MQTPDMDPREPGIQVPLTVYTVPVEMRTGKRMAVVVAAEDAQLAVVYARAKAEVAEDQPCDHVGTPEIMSEAKAGKFRRAHDTRVRTARHAGTRPPHRIYSAIRWLLEPKHISSATLMHTADGAHALHAETGAPVESPQLENGIPFFNPDAVRQGMAGLGKFSVYLIIWALPLLLKAAHLTWRIGIRGERFTSIDQLAGEALSTLAVLAFSALWFFLWWFATAAWALAQIRSENYDVEWQTEPPGGRRRR